MFKQNEKMQHIWAPFKICHKENKIDPPEVDNQVPTIGEQI